MKLLIKYALFGAYFLSSFIVFAQSKVNFTVQNQSGIPLSNAAIYFGINSSNSFVFVGFTDRNGQFEHNIPNNNVGVLISSLGFKDTLITDLSITNIQLTADTISLKEFTVNGHVKNPFLLLETSLIKGAKLYGTKEKNYSIALIEKLQNFDSPIIVYELQGFYLEKKYSPPTKNKSQMLNDKWSLNWDIYSQDDFLDPNYYSPSLYPFVTYGFACVFSPNPLNHGSTLSENSFKSNYDAHEIPSDSTLIKYQFKMSGSSNHYLLTFTKDSILLELEYFKTDTSVISIPFKGNQTKCGFGSFKIHRKWFYQDYQYFLHEFSFSGYYFSEQQNGKLSQFILSEVVTFTPENPEQKIEYNSIPIGIPIK